MATIPTPHTWVANDDATSGFLQTNTDASNFLLGGAAGRKPRIQVVMGATAQSIANAAETTLLYQTVNFDDDSAYSTVTGVYTIVTPGTYMFTATMTWASSAVGVRELGIIATGGTILESRNWNSAARSAWSAWSKPPSCLRGKPWPP